MSNPLDAIGHGLKVAGEDVVKVAELVVGVGADVFRVLTDANKLAPAFKTELATLIADAEPIASALAPVIATEGENVVLDLAAVAPVLADLKKLVSDFTAFLPTLKTALADLKTDVQPV